MGKKGSWFCAGTKALGSESKEKKDQKTQKSKRKWFGRNKKTDVITFLEETAPLPLPSPLPALEDVKLTDAENEQSKHAYSVALATAAAAEAAVAAAHAAAEVVRLTTIPRFVGKSKDEIAAIKIQTAFRGYLARRALRALRGLVRLKMLMEGPSVKRQVASSLRSMQILARLQSQIRSRRLRMSEENQALQHQLQRKHEKELAKLRASIGEEWDDRTQSKEQVEAKTLNKQEAALRRERALAYAFSHQQTWKNSSKSGNQTFMDPINPHWGWSWLERWMASRPWEAKNAVEYHDHTTPNHRASIGDINKAYARRDLNLELKNSLWTPPSQKSSRPPSRQSPSTPSKAQSSSSVSRKIKPSSPRGSGWGGDNDSRSVYSVTSDRCRRHSIAGSSVRDDESLVSSSSVPSYMVATESAKAKSRFSSPAEVDKAATPPEKESAGYAKKRLSFSSSPARPRRHSGPPVINTSAVNNSRGAMEEN